MRRVSVLRIGMLFAMTTSSWLVVAEVAVAQSGMSFRRRSQIPAAPSNLTAAPLQTSVALTWQDNSSNEVGFYVERCRGTACTPAPIWTLGANVRSFTDSQVSPLTSYTYRVRAFSGAGSNSSSALVVTTSGSNPTSPPVDCVVSDWSLSTASAWGTCTNGTQTRTETWVRSILTSPANGGAACPALTETRTGSQLCQTLPQTCQDPAATNLGGPLPCTYPQPTIPQPTIWGIVDPNILGTCSASVHDQYVLDGGDGWLYRTWHPQMDPSGCIFGHEHGDNPDNIQNAEIASTPVLFGYVGRRMNGHEEAHEGFKVFVANVGDVNDEGRINRVYSRSVFHMGTGGPKRFTMQHHSADIRLIHPEFNLKAFTRLMMDTGSTHAVCDPRANAPTKDVINLQSPCKLNSPYEIWGTTAVVWYQGRQIYRSFATPAVFDPITVLNPANPAELVYAWDPRVMDSRAFSTPSWQGHRGCQRENYAQPGYWYNGGSGRTVYYTDAMGNELPANDPNGIAQTISQSNSIGAPATSDGLVQFKMKKSYCEALSGLGLKN